MWPAEPAAEPVDEGFEIEAHEPVVDAFPWDERTPLAQRAATFSQRHWRDAILASVVLALAYGAFMAWPRSANHPTWFQSLMVRVGIMEPRTKVFAGAPETRVWIDVHTQLYYCSGEDLYGKTPDGEFTTQYNAQSDGFLPASNTTCP
jgi:hypothetical protein